jgi:hypothetical protein
MACDGVGHSNEVCADSWQQVERQHGLGNQNWPTPDRQDSNPADVPHGLRGLAYNYEVRHSRYLFSHH